ncbi:MAG: cobyrinic/hydrogenobyrinic acid a,c-diamide synthase, partial [Thermodesulfobacteriota bacterium]
SIDGVILNNVANDRHANIIRESVEKYSGVPVLGSIPKIKSVLIPERHMGLISDKEYAAEEALENIAQIVSSHVDCEKLIDIANNAPKLDNVPDSIWTFAPAKHWDVNIGVVKDASLWFYYPENLEALERAGANICEVSLLKSDPWPELHGLYLGGGFPETQAEELSQNEVIKSHVYSLSCKGMPIYAECGGFMYLCSSLAYGDRRFPMAGVFPFDMELGKKPQGHGYTRARVVRDNPFHPPGSEFVGHEFHYSRCEIENFSEFEYCLQLSKGNGVGGGRDGMVYKNTFACYTHIHALSVQGWAERFVQACKEMS